MAARKKVNRSRRSGSRKESSQGATSRAQFDDMAHNYWAERRLAEYAAHVQRAREIDPDTAERAARVDAAIEDARAAIEKGPAAALLAGIKLERVRHDLGDHLRPRGSEPGKRRRSVAEHVIASRKSQGRREVSAPKGGSTSPKKNAERDQFLINDARALARDSSTTSGRQAWQILRELLVKHTEHKDKRFEIPSADRIGRIIKDKDPATYRKLTRTP